MYIHVVDTAEQALTGFGLFYSLIIICTDPQWQLCIIHERAPHLWTMASFFQLYISSMFSCNPPSPCPSP